LILKKRRFNLHRERSRTEEGKGELKGQCPGPMGRFREQELKNIKQLLRGGQRLILEPLSQPDLRWSRRGGAIRSPIPQAVEPYEGKSLRSMIQSKLCLLVTGHA